MPYRITQFPTGNVSDNTCPLLFVRLWYKVILKKSKIQTLTLLIYMYIFIEIYPLLFMYAFMWILHEHTYIHYTYIHIHFYSVMLLSNGQPIHEPITYTLSLMLYFLMVTAYISILAFICCKQVHTYRNHIAWTQTHTHTCTRTHTKRF